MTKKLVNEAKGSIYYGMHFYPGCAEYRGPDDRVYINDTVIRNMGPSFAGKPVFVDHVLEVEDSLDKLRGEVDGWVIESFFNEADGKHWVKFIVCSEKGERAINSGMQLSNAYFQKKFGPGGTWNGITYNREILEGEFEHLAIVPNPRYEESVIMTPEKFKEYNENKRLEIKKLANSKSQGEVKMAFKWFKREKVENTNDLEKMSVMLPKSQTEVSVEKLLNEADEAALKIKNNDPTMAHPEHLVEVKGEKISVNELVKKYDALCAKNDESTKDPAETNEEDDQDLEVEEKEVENESPLKLEEEEEKEVKDAMQNESDEEEKEELENSKRKNAKAKADRLRNANTRSALPEATVMLSSDQVELGRQLFGSK